MTSSIVIARTQLFLTAIEDFVLLVTQTIRKCFSRPFRQKDFLQQMVFIGYESLPIVVFCVSFASVVTIIESSFHMKIVIKNDALVPGFASLLILRELGSVVSALLITSRVGAGIAAEVASMKITEQIDAFRMLGMEPVRFIVVPRFLACLLSGVLLSLIANLACLYCAMVVSQISLGYSPGSFMASMRTFIKFQDLIFSSIKGGCFGAVIPLFSCFYGFRCQPGAEGVGKATTQSVVSTSIAIIIIDFVLSWLFTHFY